jgi:hypothetical protein
MESKPSPGPWRKRYVPGAVFELKDAERNILLKQVGGMLPTRADQRLIEASAELYTALREYVEADEPVSDEKARALLARIDGGE